MIESILFKGISILMPQGIRVGDVMVKNGKISEIDPSISEDAELIIQEPSLLLMPGIIDAHVHFREPGAEYKESLYSGSKAAVSGGVTTFFDMPNTKPSTTTIETMAAKKEIAANTSLANYNFFIGGTNDNLHDALNVENVPGIKLYVGSSTGSLLVCEPKILDEFFATGDRLIAVHSETESMIQQLKDEFSDSTDPTDHYRMRPDTAAIDCTKMLVKLANKHQRRLHICHLTTQQEAEFLAANPSEWVTCEVSPQHLFLEGPGIYDQIGNLAKINPPIREGHHRQALLRALKQGTIQMIASDHAPHTLEEKMKPFLEAPSGMPGVETILPLMLTHAAQGHWSVEQVSRWCSSVPAALYGVESKGDIVVGKDADLVLVDLNAKKTLTHSNQITKCGWTAFDQCEVQGLPIATFVNGQMVYLEGDFFEDIKGTEVSCEKTLSPL